MNEPPGACARWSFWADAGGIFPRRRRQDALLFVDNIFRFAQAGSEVSALLGRIPSAVGYQPTLATDMGNLQERITTTNKGSITSVQAIYVPADDLTDPHRRHRLRISTRRRYYRGRSPSLHSTRRSIRSIRPRVPRSTHRGRRTLRRRA